MDLDLGAAAQAQGLFLPEMNTICSLGGQAEQGCDAIRARQTVDAAQTPWRAIGRVNFASTDLRSHCTGVLVDERLVLTAAHCLFNSARKRWIPPGSLKFVAGYQRGTAQGLSNVRRYRMDPRQGRPGSFNRDPVLDWALLELEHPLGRQVGTLPLTNTGTNGTAPFMAGYSGLRPHVLSRTDACSVTQASNGVLRGICPVMQGDSGAPLLVNSAQGPQVLGILSRIAPTRDGVDALFLPLSLFDIGGT